jgi:hypothetical protein
MKPADIYDGRAHSVTLLRSPVEKSRPGVQPPGRGAYDYAGSGSYVVRGMHNLEFLIHKLLQRQRHSEGAEGLRTPAAGGGPPPMFTGSE